MLFSRFKFVLHWRSRRIFVCRISDIQATPPLFSSGCASDRLSNQAAAVALSALAAVHLPGAIANRACLDATLRAFSPGDVRIRHALIRNVGYFSCGFWSYCHNVLLGERIRAQSQAPAARLWPETEMSLCYAALFFSASCPEAVVAGPSQCSACNFATSAS